MESDSSENKARLPNKPITFLDIPTDDVGYFLDKHPDTSYYLRIESIGGRVVIPLGDEIEVKLGALVDDYFTHLG